MGGGNANGVDNEDDPDFEPEDDEIKDTLMIPVMILSVKTLKKILTCSREKGYLSLVHRLAIFVKQR